ncbi:hypothetical protein [Halospeciosus flavus]|uniref:Uncharacterized protein n=1 Tax=Halospeciosus flavus TaxID=3032283 RepID=A0ABD5Z3C6_9EURY|nr:hypothetical protein [Halospeciosus flavus]
MRQTTMGMYDRLVVEDGLDLPKFPAERRPSEIEWQTKEIGHQTGQRYKLTAEGRLLRHEEEYRKKTAAEKQAEAESHGFDSWDEYVAFYEDADPSDVLERGLSPLSPRTQTVAEEYWVDHEMHRSFEFHSSHDDIADGFFWSYEARFTHGALEAIVFLGRRGGGGPDTLKPDEPDTIRF